MADDRPVEPAEAPSLSIHLYASGRMAMQTAVPLPEAPVLVLRNAAGGVQVVGDLDPGRTVLMLAEGMRAVLNHFDAQRAAAQAEKPTIYQPPPGTRVHPWRPTNGR